MRLIFRFWFFGPLLACPLWPGVLKPNQKVSPLSGPFGPLLSRKCVFKIFGPEPPRHLTSKSSVNLLYVIIKWRYVLPFNTNVSYFNNICIKIASLIWTTSVTCYATMNTNLKSLSICKVTFRWTVKNYCQQLGNVLFGLWKWLIFWYQWKASQPATAHSKCSGKGNY